MDENYRVSIKTVSRYFRAANPPFGIWTAGLHWTADDVNANVEILSGTIGGGSNDHNISGDVQAILAGLSRAQELGLNATVHSANDNVVRTIPEYYPLWRERGWKNSKRTTPDSLDEWHRINSICEDIDVRWERRAKGRIDAVADHAEFQRLLEDQDQEFWMHRALAKDPY